METLQHTSQHWSIYRRQVFRFFALYFILYILSTFLLREVWLPVTNIFATFFHIAAPLDTEGYGSGDTIFDYLMVFAMLITSILGSMVWWRLDHRRKHYDMLLYWLSVCIRYTLAFFMIVYGFSKIYIGQFPPPNLERLVEPYGDSSPMGLAWTFMGASRGYSIFTGILEALAGYLLFFRRTTLLGALLGIAVLTNVVAMNFFYDIPVKLFSSHLLLMALFIAAPHAGRVMRFFIYNQPVQANPYYPAFSKKWQYWLRIGIKCFIILFFTWQQGSYLFMEDEPEPPLYGIYDVKEFTHGSELLPPVLTDTIRWSRLIISNAERASIYDMAGVRYKYSLVTDTVKHTLTITDDASGKSYFNYSTPDDSTLYLSGNWKGGFSKILFRKRNPKGFLLINRGFHWINERPYNK